MRPTYTTRLSSMALSFWARVSCSLLSFLDSLKTAVNCLGPIRRWGERDWDRDLDRDQELDLDRLSLGLKYRSLCRRSGEREPERDKEDEHELLSELWRCRLCRFGEPDLDLEEEDDDDVDEEQELELELESELRDLLLYLLLSLSLPVGGELVLSPTLPGGLGGGVGGVMYVSRWISEEFCFLILSVDSVRLTICSFVLSSCMVFLFSELSGVSASLVCLETLELETLELSCLISEAINFVV